MTDEQAHYETLRRQMVADINANPNPREAIEAEHGQVWDTSEMTTDFDVTAFAAPLVVVKRKSDNQVGTLMFQHMPRFYFAFKTD